MNKMKQNSAGARTTSVQNVKHGNVMSASDTSVLNVNAKKMNVPRANVPRANVLKWRRKERLGTRSQRLGTRSQRLTTFMEISMTVNQQRLLFLK